MQPEAHMDAWRAVIDQRFGDFLDELYEERLKKFYVVAKKDEPTRPIVEQAFKAVLDDLFDPTHYPDGMDHAAVMARATAEFKPQLHAILDPQWEALMLEGKRNHYKNSRSWSFTTLVDECVHRSDYLVQSMEDEGKKLTHETAQRVRLPMGIGALREACVREGETAIKVVLDGLKPFYTVTEQAKLTLHVALEKAVDDAIAAAKDEEGGLHRKPLVEHVLSEDFSKQLSIALSHDKTVLLPKRAFIGRKELAPVFATPRVQTDLRFAVARCINDAFVKEAPEETPQTTVEKKTIEFHGVDDYRKVPFFHGADMVSRQWTVRDHFELLIAGNPSLEPLQEQIFKAVRAAEPPIVGRTKPKNSVQYFDWLEKDSAASLETKLSGIEGLIKAERDMLVEAHTSLIPTIIERAHRNADHTAEAMIERGMTLR